ncbi:MAG TPA: hypothetical protein VGS10_05775 [Terracidiphilus sp.]|nr:hypothetical protein [Terracidiphilus sp.]
MPAAIQSNMPHSEPIHASVGNHNLEDHPICVGQDILTVEFAPFISCGRTTQVTGTPVVDVPSAIPVFMPDMAASLPVVVTDVLIMMVLVVAIPVIVVILGGGNTAS